MPDFDTVTEVILHAEDMERMVSFYTDVMGLEIAGGDPDHGFVRFDAEPCSLAIHAGGEGDVGRDAPSFVFEVEDIEAARSYLQDHGVELSEVRSPAPGVQVSDGHDPEGNLFSIKTTGAPA